MPELRYGQARIPYEVVVSQRRATVGIQVYLDRRVVVHTPGRVPARQVEQIVCSKAPWILKQLAAVEASHLPPRRFTSGEVFPCLGQSYPLELRWDDGTKPLAQLVGNNLVVWLPAYTGAEQQGPAVRAALEAWYMAQARELLPGRVAPFCQLVGRQPARVSVRSPQLSWGSCASNGNINLNWRLVMAPLPVVDYVAAHEVCHLREHNHSAAFWELVGKVLPGYREHKEWLRVNGQRLAL
jgi:predicted metal-dependent hydrolase